MEIGDLNTFFTSNKALANVMSVTTVSDANPELSKEIFARITKAHMKARSRIVKVLNDMYYQEMDEEECLNLNIEYLPDGQIKTQEDVEKFISEHMASQMPLDRPQWKVWVQRKYLGDKGIVIWKAHHSLCDGMSSMAFNL